MTAAVIFSPTSQQQDVARAIRRELFSPVLWRSPFGCAGAVLYESDTTPGVAFVVQPDGGLSMPVALGEHARGWRLEHPDSDRQFGYVPRTARIVRDALERL